MELVLRLKPRNTSHRILGTSPASNVLDIPNETDIPCAPLPSHRHTYTSHALGSPVSSRHDHRMAPTIVWPKLVPNGDGYPKHNWLSGLPPFTRPRQLPRVDRGCLEKLPRHPAG